MTDQPAPSDAGAWRGGHVRDGAWCALAPNPSPMTLDGTNTWILWAPGTGSSGSDGSDAGPRECAVVDPGPLDEGHLQAVAAHLERLGLRCARILLTHRHLDHTEGAQRFAELVGAPIDFPGRDHPGADEPVDLGIDGLAIVGLATPGHTSDSYSFHVPALGALLTGDTILGRGTTVVAWPDGAIRPYLASLDALAELVEEARVEILLPGHGAPRTDAARVIAGYATHRHERLDQVREALRALGVGELGVARLDPEQSSDARDDLVERVVETVYAQVPREVWPAARLSVRAQLDYLADDRP